MLRNIFVLIFALLTSGSWAHPLSISQRQMERVRRMPFSFVNQILQDNEGYMWYATSRGGLCRDNGYQIELFRSDRNNPDLIADNNVLSMLEISEHRILFGTRKGVYYLHKHDYSIHCFDSIHLSGQEVPSILTDKQGVIWIAHGHAVSTYSQSGKHIHTYQVLHEGKPINIENLFVDSRDNVWVMQSNGGLGVISGGNYIEKQWLWTTPTCMTEMDGILFIGTNRSGVIRYEQNQGLPIENIVKEEIHDILYDDVHNILWLTSRYGLNAFDISGNDAITNGTLKSTPSCTCIHPGLANNRLLRKLYFDRQGNLWVSGYIPHLFVMTFPNGDILRERLEGNSTLIGENSRIEKTYYEYPSSFWIFNSKTGLSLYDYKTQVLKNIDIHTAERVIAAAHNGGIWTTDGSHIYWLFRQEDGNPLSQMLKIGTLEGNITYLYEIKGGLYIATENTLYRYTLANSQLSEIMGSGQHLSGIESVIEISDDLLMCTSPTLGIFLLRGNRMIHLQDYHSEIEPILDERHNTIWIANRLGSVFRLDIDKLQSVTNEQCDRNLFVEDIDASNQNGDAIRQILLDSGGHLWILSDKYISEYNPETRIKRVIYGHDPEIEMGNFHWCCETVNGVTIGGSDGFCYIKHTNTLDIPHTSVNPKVSSYKANGQKHFVGIHTKELHISPDITNLVLYLTTYDAIISDNVTFAYRLKEVNTDWIYLPQGINALSLINLQKGTYTLQVKATDGSSCWNEPIDCITIIRMPAWWETWWAISLQHLTVLAIILLMIYQYLHMLYRRRRFDRIIAMINDKHVISQELSQPSDLDGDTTTEPDNYSISDLAAEDGSSNDISVLDQNLIEKAIGYVEKNISNETYGVNQFSIDMCMSRVNLYRHLLRVTGQTPSDFIKSYRLTRAAQLITERKYSITVISEMTGFSSPSYFRKCFKNKFGVLPSNYKG